MSVNLTKPLRGESDLTSDTKPRIVEIYRYWDRKRGTNTMPRRRDIDPADLTHHLPGLLLVDVEGENAQGCGIYRYRVVGTREVANRRGDPTGKLVEEGYFGTSAEEALRSYEAVRLQRAPIFEPLSFVSDNGIRIDEISIYLPLSENGTDVSQILVYSENVREEHPVPLRDYVAGEDESAKTDPAPPSARSRRT